MQFTSKAERQKWYLDRKPNAILLETDDLVLAKANACKGKRKVKDWWEKELHEVEWQVTDGVPSYLVKNQQTEWSQVFPQNQHFLINPMRATLLCIVVQAEWASCATTTLEEPTPGRSETEEVPQSVKCLPPAQ